MPDKKNLEMDEIDDNDDGGTFGNIPLDNGELDFINEDEFDEDGNLIDKTEDEPQEEPDGEPDDESVEEDTEELPFAEPVESKKKLSSIEIKLINLKKENQRLANELKLKSADDSKVNLANELKTLEETFVKEGYDEDTAKRMSANEIRMKQLEEKTAKYDFMEQNEDVFKRYPNAKTDIVKIMNNAKLTGMTPEQICRGLYIDETPLHEQKAIKAVKGEITDTDRKPNLNTARSSSSNENLNPSEIREKAKLERMFNNGEPLTVADYRKYKK